MPELAISLDSLVLSKDIWGLEDLNPQIERIYLGLSGESIDFGVMEKSDEVMVIPAEFGWSDVGSWSAIPEVMAADDVGNLSINTRENIVVDSSGCLVYGGGKLTALVGIKDLIVVDTPDALLVCGMDRAQDVKKIVEKLEKMNLSEYL
jgi:mannose-1-phosphate guanylyltransferase